MNPKKWVATIILMLLLCSIVIAAIPDTTDFKKVPNHLKREISLKMSFPQAATDQLVEGVVTTCFYLTKDGTIKVTCLNGPPLLTDYVKTKLESISLKQTYALINQPLLLRFRFENPLY